MRAPEPVRVLFDATRLASRRGAAPTGIDRVDLAYVNGLAAAPGVELQLVRFDALGPVLLAPEAAREIAALWHERVERGVPQPAFERLRAWLESPAGAIAPSAGAAAPRFGPRDAWRAARNAFDRPLDALRLDARLASPGAWLYLNTSHGALYRRSVLPWLRRSGVRSVFFVHDLIPIEHPEYNRRSEPARHARRLATIAAHASQVLVNSAVTRDALLRHWAQQRQGAVPVEVLPLGVQQVLPAAGSVAAPRAGMPYFVALSTIEPRKNHALLLDAWEQLVARLGDSAPRLVLVGRRGWENQAVFDRLDRLRGASRHVSEIAGLDDAALAGLLRGACALLSPSHVEGFGLPVAEALALGTPVLASDIAAHREIAGGCAELLAPADRAAWIQAVTDYAAPASARRARQQARLAAYQAPRWDAHLGRAIDLLRAVAAAPAPLPLAGVAPYA